MKLQTKTAPVKYCSETFSAFEHRGCLTSTTSSLKRRNSMLGEEKVESDYILPTDHILATRGSSN